MNILGRRVTSNIARALFEMEWERHHIVLEWVNEEIAAFPEVQQKVQAEIKTIVGYDRLPVVADLTDMPYVRSVVLELFRLKSFPLLKCIWM